MASLSTWFILSTVWHVTWWFRLEIVSLFQVKRWGKTYPTLARCRTGASISSVHWGAKPCWMFDTATLSPILRCSWFSLENSLRWKEWKAASICCLSQLACATMKSSDLNTPSHWMKLRVKGYCKHKGSNVSAFERAAALICITPEWCSLNSAMVWVSIAFRQIESTGLYHSYGSFFTRSVYAISTRRTDYCTTFCIQCYGSVLGWWKGQYMASMRLSRSQESKWLVNIWKELQPAHGQEF